MATLLRVETEGSLRDPVETATQQKAGWSRPSSRPPAPTADNRNPDGTNHRGSVHRIRRLSFANGVTGSAVDTVCEQLSDHGSCGRQAWIPQSGSDHAG